jgi:pectinesterase
MTPLLICLVACFSFLQVVNAASRTSPPAGAIVVRAGTTNPGEFATLSAAVSSLPNDGSSKSIFIFPGTYNGQTFITRTGPLTVCGLPDLVFFP